jgi:uncharacterized RDD family membrane protein YckC
MEKIDSVFIVETPEGVQLPLRVAGLTSRVLAGLVDQIILWVVLYVMIILVALIAAFTSIAVVAVLFVFLFFIGWFYPVFCEMFFRGQTIGKWLLGLMVVQTNGAPVGWRNSITRALLLWVDLVPILGIPLMLWNRKFQRLGDIAADTIVIHLPKARTTVAIPALEPISAGAFLPEENEAILELAQRHASLSEARSQEIAETLSAIWGVPPALALRRLYSHARFITGGTR